jgi:UDP-N-acetylmuramoyl-L-alanyl-D-glutamate--2,6-diaminopimelate ligase
MSMTATPERVMIIDNMRDLIAALDALPAKPTGATVSSREVKAGDAFLAYPGAARDGRDFIADAITRGAAVVLIEAEPHRKWMFGNDVPHIVVRSLKTFASAIGSYLYRQPSNDLWMVGVTGTNGKTSVSQWIARALEMKGRTSAVIGTIGNGLVREALADAANTTPDAVALQAALRTYVDAGASACAMEVSSHGLDQGRVANVKYDVAVFTNLTRDHLDYHHTMEAYGEAKAKLFTMPGLKTAVVNVDDVFGREIASRAERRGVDVIRFAMNGGSKFANLIATDISMSSAGLSFRVRLTNQAPVEALVESNLLGSFNVSNLLAVIGALIASGFNLKDAAATVSELKSVPGRMQTIREPKKPLMVVDYAHTPDALEKALSTLAAIVPDRGRLISVFGCGGDRDRGKRPQMGAISAKYADFTIITSDNPRTEDLIRIIDDIVVGVGSAPHYMIADRKLAIVDALERATADDVILIAGKGHEDYQIVGTSKHHFSDVEVARDALTRWQGGAR